MVPWRGGELGCCFGWGRYIFFQHHDRREQCHLRRPGYCCFQLHVDREFETHRFASVQLIGGAVLTHQAATTNQIYALQLTIAGNLLVDASSSINASGLGYLEGYTLGNTTNGAAYFTAGGSYGGLGGLCCHSTDNAVYGDYHFPNELGSGSGTYRVVGDRGRVGANYWRGQPRWMAPSWPMAWEESRSPMMAAAAEVFS